ncbi:hypothetical protein E3Q10_01165 [Wallemia mellicola]|uniref:FYVE zinc finger domain-containing protein n=1 Tax=Wallemia mellicola TaxID=1708541 RepID=A0A4T0QA23_9BASI|nr:hypothetical protein E3Q19_00498 [Wallemia mellicola]TIC14512.1 hypothetical protein E3Q14_00838 [Wallemia mellicola]TIC20885.1 hypothetical protein E3Q13_00187 [Wallemia mellicola]TIC32530.1 hypothetical protein E3Q10_01165 [Wallemia mellicola]TIC58467.1 hypothetical protein E3Q05_00830 [Wallemia mellicola]
MSKNGEDAPKTQFRRLRPTDNISNNRRAHQRTLSSQSSPIASPSTAQISQIPKHSFNRSISTVQQPSTSSSPIPDLNYQIYAKSRSPSFTSTFSTSSMLGNRRTPYRVGFQPKGVTRDRIQDFTNERDKHKRDDKDMLNDRRLMRRLDKLFEVHNKHNDAFGLLSDIRLRSQEQNVVKWEDDKAVQWCPIAHVQFNPLKYRKHHCRMCGRVVSAAVVEKDPIKRRASVVMTKDPSGKIRMCRLDEEITGIRVCLECWKVVERQEMRVFIPRYMRAYKEAILLEKELNDKIKGDAIATKELMAKTQRLEYLIKEFDEPTALCRAISTKFKGSLGIYMGLLKRQVEKERMAAKAREDESKLDDSDDSKLQALFEQQSQLLQQIERTKEARKFEDVRILTENLEFVNKLIEEI